MTRHLALLGGTFDPPHVGHLVVASEVRFRGGFDAVHLVVANDPWQKRGSRVVTPAADRLAMVEAAVAGHDGLVVDDREIRRGGATYTVDTVEELLAEEPGVHVSLVLGADAVAGLDTWHRAAELAELVDVVAVARPGHDLRPVGGHWRTTVIEVPAIDVSSTDIRARSERGEPVDFLVTDAVRSVMVERGLYGGRR